MRNSWLVACLLNFVIAATMGLLLRFVKVFPIAIDYQNLIHAHSHTAMFGWAYMAIFSLFVYHFVPKHRTQKYQTLFWLTQGTVIGMMITFPIRGYWYLSIAFSSLHILCSYFFCYLIWKDSRTVAHPSQLLVRAALLFMLLSTIGAWSLGIISNLAGKQSALYKSAIQFFLHFQFNGWFIAAVLAVLFATLFNAGISVSPKRFRVFYTLFIVSVLLTIALPLSWFYSHPALFYVNLAGLLVQVAALAMFFVMLYPKIREINEKIISGSKWLLMLSLVSLVIKMILQVATAFPEIATAAYKVRNLAIGFIHLTMLGLVTGFLFFFLAGTKFIRQGSNFWKTGITLFYIGFLLTELLLFAEGAMIYLKMGTIDNNPYFLFLASMLLPAGLILILWSLLKNESAESHSLG